MDNNNLDIQLRYLIDDNGIAEFSSTIDQANANLRNLAANIRNVKNAIDGIDDATDDVDTIFRRFGSNSTNIMNKFKSGVQSASSTLTELREEYQRLNNLLNSTDDNKAQNAIRASMAQTMSNINQIEKQITQMRKNSLNEREALGQQSLARELQNQKDHAEHLKQIWQQSNREYNRLQKELNATSTLKDFTSGASVGLKQSIFNAGLSLAGVRAIAAEFQNLGSEILNIDYNLVNTQRIMQDFSSETADFLLDNAVETAKLTNIQITDAQNIQAAWVRINDQYAKNRELLTDITTLTSKFMNVGEIEDAEEAVTLLNASILQFYGNVSNASEIAEEFANKWAYMADITAMGTADEYGSAISKYGAQVKALNGGMDESIALASVMADKLAKNGDEAGNSLKTITTYLNREKTQNLFSRIAEDLGDTNFQLVNANGRMKDFDATLRSIAEAYRIYSEAGNDVMAQDILNAIGATRQRDAALAVLNSVNDGSYDKYLMELQGEGVDGYLDEQNTALTDTLIAQLNELKVSIQGALVSIVDAGVLDGVELLANGFTGLFDVISQIPEPILSVVNAFAALKVAQSAAEYVGNLTGVTQRYQQLTTQGTQTEIDNANAVNIAAQAYRANAEETINLALQKQTLGTLNEDERNRVQELIYQYDGQRVQMAQLESAYNNGYISANQYSQAMESIIGTEYRSIQSKQDAVDTMLVQMGVMTQEEAERRKNIRAIEEQRLAEENGTLAKQRGVRATLSRVASIAKETFETNKAKNAVVAKTLSDKVMNSTLMTLITTENTHNTVGRVMTGVFTGIGTAAAGASAGVKLFMSALNPILAVVSVITTIASLGGMLFDFIGTDAEDNSERLSEMQEELSKTQERIEELKQANSEGSLSVVEDEELAYLKEKNRLLEQSIQLKQQEINNDEFLNHQGGFLGFGGEDSGVEELDKLISSYEEAQSKVNAYSNYLKDSSINAEQAATANEKLSDANKELRNVSADLISKYYELGTAIENGSYSGEALDSAKEYLKTLGTMIPTADLMINGYDKLSNSINQVAQDTEAYAEDLEGLNGVVKNLNDLFDEYNKEGYLSYETVSKLIAEQPEYVKYLVKVGDQYKLNVLAEKDLEQANQDIIASTDEMIEGLNNQTNAMNENAQVITEGLTDVVDSLDQYSQGIKQTFGDIEGVNKFVDDLEAVHISLLKGESSIDDYNESMNRLINETDFSKLNDEIGMFTDKTTKVTIRSQQAMFSSLASEVGSYMQEITNALYTGEMSASQYVEALQASNQNVLDLFVASEELTLNQAGQWVDASGAVNEYANSLQNAINGINGMTEATQMLEEHQSILAELQANTANGMVDSTWWAATENSVAYQTMADDFSSLMTNLYTNNKDAWTSITKQVYKEVGNQYGEVTNASGAITETAQGNAAVMGAFTNAIMGTVGSTVSTLASKGGEVLTSLGNAISSFDYTITFQPVGGFGFDASRILKGQSPFTWSSLGLKITGTGGSSVKSFANSLSSFGSSLSANSGSLGSFFNNISSYKPSGYTPSSYTPSGSYSPSGGGSSADRYTPATRYPSSSSSSGGSSSSGKSDAEKAAEDAAKALEEAAKAIEKLTNEYVKNVESMYDRIAKALKKQYQEEYDERKKLLEQEHNARVEQIQAEIDAIEGNRPQDKQARLNNLRKQYDLWMADDSTLGKSKQKEYLDQIKELEKEIKLDELEEKLDEENENYENSIDQDSEFYDAILKKLDQQMTDEALYREARDLIVNNKQQEIIDLLTKYDAQWDGWATLMGATAGEVIAKEVALAIANYKDVVNGTVTENGGVNTNKVNGVTTNTSTSGSSSSTSSSSSSSGGSITTGKRVKINNKSAGMYYTSSSSGAVNNWNGYDGTYYVVNDVNGRAALARTNNISGAIGWIDKKYLVALSTGGYTGNNEGLAMLHAKERVLSAQQTSAFDHLVYDFLPKISRELLNTSSDTINNGGDINFHKELVKVDIGQVVNNKQFDVDNGADNLSRQVAKALRKSGINLKK